MLQSYFHIAYGKVLQAANAVSYRTVLIAAGALLVFGLLVQLLLTWLKSDNVGFYRTLRRFVIKRGKIRKENSAVFCRKTASFFNRAERREMKAFFASEAEYRSSDFSLHVREKLYAPKRKPKFAVVFGLLTVGALQGALLIKGASWLSVYAASAAALAVLGVSALISGAFYRVGVWRDAKAAVKADALMCNYVCTGSDAKPARVDLRNLDCKAGTANVGGVYRLGDSVGEFLEGCPDKGLANLIASSIERAALEEGLSACEKEYLTGIVGRIKSYCV